MSKPCLALTQKIYRYVASKSSLAVFDDGAVFASSREQERRDILDVLIFIVQFFVGICMLCIVSWLVVFRMKEVKECWRRHRHIRHYFGLTIIGTFVNLSLGICGTINIVIAEPE